jgi:hypothetical protein
LTTARPMMFSCRAWSLHGVTYPSRRSRPSRPNGQMVVTVHGVTVHGVTVHGVTVKSAKGEQTVYIWYIYIYIYI